MDEHIAATPEQQERGRQAEEHFFRAWEQASPKDYEALLLVDITKATMHEDFLEKTDAVAIPFSGPNIRIQIKSYSLTEEHRMHLLLYGVVPLTVHPAFSPEEVRRQTRVAICDFLQFQKNRRDRRIHETQRAPSWTNSFYKRGKKVPEKKRPRR